jgi:proline iminopeptidase
MCFKFRTNSLKHLNAREHSHYYNSFKATNLIQTSLKRKLQAAKYEMKISLISTCVLVLACLSFSKLNAQKKYATMPDGTKLYYYVTGKGSDTLIFLHGGPGQNSNGVAPDLMPLAKNHVLIVYDQRGCGLSDIGDTLKLNVDAHVNDLEDLREFFNITRMTLIGHSWGGMLSALYTGRYPTRVKRLLLLAPGPPTRQLFRQRFIAFVRKDSAAQIKVAKARAILESAPDPLAVCREIHGTNEKLYFLNDENIKRKKGNYCDVPSSAILKQATTARLTLQSLGDYDLKPLIEKISQPALVVEGAQTPVPMEEFETWAKTLPEGRLLLIEETGHAYPFVENPKVFFKAAEEFISGKWPVDARIIK